MRQLLLRRLQEDGGKEEESLLSYVFERQERDIVRYRERRGAAAVQRTVEFRAPGKGEDGVSTRFAGRNGIRFEYTRSGE